MIQRVLNSKDFLAVLLAMVTGTVLYFEMPWPMMSSTVPSTWNEYFLRLIALRDPWTYAGLKASYHVLLFTTPYIGYSFLLSALYIFTLRPRGTVKPQPLPLYPAIRTRDELYVVIGEVHNPRQPIPAENPYWLTIPARGLFTGTIVIGATGSGKTACSMYPFTDQLLGYKTSSAEERLSGIVLEVKGDFCGKVRSILKGHGRDSDYISISLNSEWAYNPLENELDGYSMAVGIANLLTSLFGKGKEPFWQQAYTNLVKFTIILHKVGFGYVTLFDVYESAISSRVLEKKIKQAEENILGKPFLSVPRETFQSHARELADAGFEADPTGQVYKVADSASARDALQKAGIEPLVEREAGPDGVDEDRKERLESVKRWYSDDWSNLDKKLQTSVVEGISVFLSLFDDNPPVKRLFCPPAELYKPGAAPIRGKRALPPMRDLLELGKIVALDFPAGENPGLARAIAVMLKMDFQRAMPKWCHRHLPDADITIVEINPQVIALRDRFYIPEDDHRFRVLCENGADYVARAPGETDVLIVDGYDINGLPPELCSQRFYDDCYRALSSCGLMVVNLCDWDDQVDISRIGKSFGDQIFIVTPEDGNAVVFALKGNP